MVAFHHCRYPGILDAHRRARQQGGIVETRALDRKYGREHPQLSLVGVASICSLAATDQRRMAATWLDPPASARNRAPLADAGFGARSSPSIGATAGKAPCRRGPSPDGQGQRVNFARRSAGETLRKPRTWKPVAKTSGPNRSSPSQANRGRSHSVGTFRQRPIDTRHRGRLP